jgi:hypothetical protein
VLAYGGGGPHAPDNYLPAHRLCNNYRWDYLPEELQWILKMGVWARTLMQESSSKNGLGRQMAESFLQYLAGLGSGGVGAQPRPKSKLVRLCSKWERRPQA